MLCLHNCVPVAYDACPNFHINGLSSSSSGMRYVLVFDNDEDKLFSNNLKMQIRKCLPNVCTLLLHYCANQNSECFLSPKKRTFCFRV